jgi:transposase, IS5 family
LGTALFAKVGEVLQSKGMKVDTGTIVDATIISAAANVHGKHAIQHLLHGAELDVWDDSAYASQPELIASKAPQAPDRTNRRVGAADIAADIERIVTPRPAPGQGQGGCRRASGRALGPGSAASSTLLQPGGSMAI